MHSIKQELITGVYRCEKEAMTISVQKGARDPPQKQITEDTTNDAGISTYFKALEEIPIERTVLLLVCG